MVKPKKSNKILDSIKDFIKNLKDMLPFGKKKVEEEVDIDVALGSVSSDTFEKKELSEADKKAQEAAKQELIEKKKKFKKLIRRIIIVIVAIIAFIVFLVVSSKIKKKNKEKTDNLKKSTEVKKMNIASELSGSGTLAAKDSYTITALVEGNVISADFEVGDIVKKDQLLYEIESGTAYRSIVNASSSLAQAQDNYDKAKIDYEKSESDFSDGIYHSQFTGIIKQLNIKAGDVISGSTEIGTIVNDKKMSIKVPFLAIDANTLSVGSIAYMVLSDTDEVVVGKIVNIDKEPQSYKSGAQVKYVKVECDNPGGLSTSHTAQVMAGNVWSIADGNFEVESEEKITLGDGKDIEIEYLIANEGQYVTKGSPLFKITDKTILNATSAKKNSFLSAEASLQKAENTLEDACDSYDEYYIKAPIDGTIITKDAKVGAKL
ncbi:MAG: efflux RND transporter periplasmic adaptor subunit, partial [Lachnospiraceae bacterium]|nr:efflux RND transporter periplasmic adaptor subunit [Lachnospiraceae bacterium]